MMSHLAVASLGLVAPAGPNTSERRPSDPTTDFGPAMDEARESLETTDGSTFDGDREPVTHRKQTKNGASTPSSAEPAVDKPVESVGEHTAHDSQQPTAVEEEPVTPIELVPPAESQWAAGPQLQPLGLHAETEASLGDETADAVELPAAPPEAEATDVVNGLSTATQRTADSQRRLSPSLDPAILAALDATEPISEIEVATDTDLATNLVEAAEESLGRFQVDDVPELIVESDSSPEADAAAEPLSLESLTTESGGNEDGEAIEPQVAVSDQESSGVSENEVAAEQTATGSGQSQSAPAPTEDDAAVAPPVVVESKVTSTESPTNDRVGSLTNENTALDAEAETALWEQVQRALGRVRAAADGQDVRLRLTPADLGELLVRVNTAGDNVNVRLVVSSQAAHQTLLDDRNRLANELLAAGFKDGSVDISHDDGGSDQRTTQDQRQQGESGPEPQSWGGAGSVEPVRPSARTRSRTDSVIDLVL